MKNDSGIDRPPVHSPTVWIVMPAYNEAERIEQTLQLLTERGWNVVLVDDGSVDDTASVAARYPIWVLRHPINCGQGAALKTGINFALERGAEVIVTFDSDGQHEVQEIPQMIAPVLSGDADVALGSRFLGEARDMPWTRRLTLKLAILFTRLTSGLMLTDAHNGFRAFSSGACQRIRIQQPRMAHASEILEAIARLNLRFVEVPVTITYRAETLDKGQSSLGALRITGHLLAGRIWK